MLNLEYRKTTISSPMSHSCLILSLNIIFQIGPIYLPPASHKRADVAMYRAASCPCQKLHICGQAKKVVSVRFKNKCTVQYVSYMQMGQRGGYRRCPTLLSSEYYLQQYAHYSKLQTKINIAVSYIKRISASCIKHLHCGIMMERSRIAWMRQSSKVVLGP